MAYLLTGVLPLIIVIIFVIIRLVNKRYHDGWVQGYEDCGRDTIEVNRMFEEWAKGNTEEADE